MRKVHFCKYQGAGNDFIIADNRAQQCAFLDYKLIAALCERKFGIGADGLMLLTTAAAYPFGMAFYNSDGLPGSMCGNGGRCLAAYVYDKGVVGLSKAFKFWSSDGEHEAVIVSSLPNTHLVRLRMRDIPYFGHNAEKHSYLIDTGSPHYVIFVDDVEKIDVVQEGRNIRCSRDFPEGINVDFVQIVESKRVKIRTYERGVEDETLSCGTGATAAAICLALERNFPNGYHYIQVEAKGGSLAVEMRFKKKYRSTRLYKPLPEKPDLPLGFEVKETHKIDYVYLEGLAKKVFEGDVEIPEY